MLLAFSAFGPYLSPVTLTSMTGMCTQSVFACDIEWRWKRGMCPMRRSHMDAPSRREFLLNHFDAFSSLSLPTFAGFEAFQRECVVKRR